MDLAEILFIGPTYVYRGEYPRRDSLVAKSAVKKSGGGGVARFGKTRAMAGIVDDEDEVESDRMSPEERVERGKSQRGEGENRDRIVTSVFGARGLRG